MESIEKAIKLYRRGLISVSECLVRIDDTVKQETGNIDDTNKQIKQANKLYRSGLYKLVQAIKANDTLSN